MPVNQAFLGELEQEAPNTRKTLERIPFDKGDWKPHEKSFAMVPLATHVANILNWGTTVLTTPELVLTPDYKEERPQSSDALLALFDKHVGAFREALQKASDEAMMAPWTLKMGDKVLFTLPRAAVLRGMIINHMIHHRAQLGVYLRLNNIPVPAIYGPSADEGQMG